jgi:hypothetical protein
LVFEKGRKEGECGERERRKERGEERRIVGIKSVSIRREDRNPLIFFSDLHKFPKFKLFHELGSTLNEEFIVLHVEQKKGYKVQVSGCSDNKILGMEEGEERRGTREEGEERDNGKQERDKGKREKWKEEIKTS